MVATVYCTLCHTFMTLWWSVHVIPYFWLLFVEPSFMRHCRQWTVGVWLSQQKAACLHKLHQQLSKWDYTAERRQEGGMGSSRTAVSSSAKASSRCRSCSCPDNTNSGSSLRWMYLVSLCCKYWRRKAVFMSLQKLPGSFGVMFPAFTLPKAERSRNKERLEASLAGLCELELLKQRQESRVLSALCLGDSSAPSRPPWGALRSARCSLDAPKGNEADDYGVGLQIVSLAYLQYNIYIVCWGQLTKA